MKYLVHRKTKEHKVLHRHTEYATCDWRIVEADFEGWIPHVGDVCPLPDDVLCEAKVRTGKTAYSVPVKASSLYWEQTGMPGNIVAYRPILAEKAQEPDYDPRSVSFNLLDRLKAAHAQAQTIPDLEAELRGVLAGMGYDLVARSPFANQCCGNPEQCWEPCGDLGKSEEHVAVAEPDMTDWRNWREGDVIEVVGAVDSYWKRFYPVGAIRTVITDNDGDFGVGDTAGDVLTFGRLGHKKFKPECFRFHSRPAKREK